MSNTTGKNITGDKPVKTKKTYTEEQIFEMLAFTDFYLNDSNAFEGSFMYYAELLKPKKIEKDQKAFYNAFIKTVRTAYKDANEREDFVVVFLDRCFRACAMKHTTKGLIFAIRQTNVNYKNLKELNLGGTVVKELMHSRLNKGGLIIISGSPGNGKSTTSAALILKRLSDFGGLCITIEDPPEFPLEGEHGNGYCIQNQIEHGGTFADAIRTSMRSYPTGQRTVMFVGEVRDTETAVEVIKASIDGRLVIATLHANSVYSALKRLATLANEELGSEAYNMLSDSFRVGIHQTLKKKITKKKSTIKNKKALLFEMHVDCLVNTTPCSNNIRENNIERIKNEMEVQKNKWSNNERVIYHTDDN